MRPEEPGGYSPLGLQEPDMTPAAINHICDPLDQSPENIEDWAITLSLISFTLFFSQR